MDMNGRKYIAYGSNLNREQMAQRCPDAKVIGSGMLKDYELLFRGYTDAAVATVEPKEGENVLMKGVRKSMDRMMQELGEGSMGEEECGQQQL